MSNNKLAPVTDWRNRAIDDWNTTTFTKYIEDKHYHLFGITYAPFGGTWSMEQGIIGTLIGTKSRKNPKVRTASNEAVKRFIDETFGSYTPNEKYPGTSFGFMWTYKKYEWQRIEAEELSKEKGDKAVEEGPSLDDINNWI